MEHQSLQKVSSKKKPKTFVKKKIRQAVFKKNGEEHTKTAFKIPRIFSSGFFATKGWKMGSVIGVTLFCAIPLVVAVFYTVQLQQKKNVLLQQRHELNAQVTYWEKVVREHPDYRDGYFQLALLQYQLGAHEKSSVLLDKVLQLDPNFEYGIRLQKIAK